MNFDFLSQEQKTAVDLIENYCNVFITGSAGTGKSYLIQYLKKNLNDRIFHITATTGIASINIGGTTIHSWASIGIEEIPILEVAKKILSAEGTHTRKKIQNADTLIIDEISMLSKSTFENLNLLLQLVRGNQKPFGGIQLILFGDFFQLPPVKSDEYCFESEVWQQSDIEVVLLKKNFRQQQENFLTLLNHIRYGNITANDIKIINSRFTECNDKIFKPTIITTHNFTAETINNKHLNDIAEKSFLFEAKFKGDKNKIEVLRRNCIAKENLTLKIGSQVMMLKNTYHKDGIINGSTGIVKSFVKKRNGYLPVVQFENGVELEIKYDVWEIGKFNSQLGRFEVEATMEQIPLILAWAITVHKSQGMSLDKIECDLAKSFADGQIYVALSRVRNLEGLFIKSFNKNCIKTNQKVVEFYKELL